jgi:AraC-like DNA-binding protein
MSESFTIAAGWVARFYRALIDFGVAEKEIRRVSGIKKIHLVNPDDRIPIERYVSLGRMAPVLTNTPEIGLILGQQARFQSIGIIFQLAVNCKTVRDSLQHIVRYEKLGNEVSKVELSEKGRYVEWGERYTSSRYLCVPLLEFECCQKMEISRFVSGGRYLPIHAKFQYPAPDYVEKYEEVFQAPLSFEQKGSGLIFEKEYLDFPNPNPQPYLKKILAQHADKLQTELNQSKRFQDQARKIIIHNLDSGTVSLDMIAGALNVSRRTAYRKLRQEGINYKDLLRDVKKQLAQFYLQDASLSISEISFLLGFSEASAFHRAFKRWFGVNPGQYRRKTG